MPDPVEVNLYGDVIKAVIPVVSVIIGGALGGGISYFVSKSNFNREKERKESEEFRTLIREIAIDFSEFEDSAYKLLAYHVDDKAGTPGNPFSYEEVHAEYANSLAKFRKAKATIKILGLERAEKLLHQCNDSSRKVFVSHKRLKTAEVKDCFSQLKRQSQEFYEVLSSYSSINSRNT